jgi:hypothetical protein
MTMTCDRIDELLPAWIEDDLGPAARDAVSAHLGECLRCAAIVRDLTALRRDAAQLAELVPPRDLWDGIAARIDAPVIAIASRQSPLAVPSRRIWTLAAAATLLVAVSSGITWSIAMRGASDAPAQAATTAAPESPSTTDLAALTAPPTGTLASAEPFPPEVLYGREIEDLRAILVERSAELDSSTVAAVVKSLQSIDIAIAEARAALARDASSPFLHDQLNRALQKKLGVLRTAALLPMGAS